MTTTLSPGTVVRLSFDQGPRSFGVILDGDVTTRDDGVRLLPTVWGDREPIEDFAAVVDQLDARDEVDGYSVMRLAETILTPICEHVDVFADEWGLACSEPGVPTTIEIPCGFDATRRLVLHSPFDREDSPFALCEEHAALYRKGAAEEVVADEPI